MINIVKVYREGGHMQGLRIVRSLGEKHMRVKLKDTWCDACDRELGDVHDALK